MARKPKHELDGEAVPTVTDILNLFGDKYFLNLWYGKHGIEECNRVKNESAKFGSAVHDLVEKHLRGKKLVPEPHNRIHQCADMLVRWCEEAKVKPYMLPGNIFPMELELQSRQFKYVGHPDLLCTFGDNSHIWVLDWKTSNSNDRNFALQIAGYAQAAKEQFGIVINDGAILRVSKDPTADKQFEVHEYHNLFEDYVPLFLHLRELYDFAKKKGRWKNAA